ncbi:hypothetical protein DDZ16_15200 [Marinilabilia rubra]|uniref:Peptidyl-prolyl cis-trans isomerase n=1 Tax=Marinilabilia rubra TaxID=2162893 RepID=A0A2U2B6C3_9BACT|nr:hypothetical protein DDZ16_15200 [Marinilabilia rubra]
MFLYTCKHAEDDGGSREIVRVGNELLTSSDLNQVLPRDVNDEDSAALADDYINRWVRNKLFLRQAEFNLTEEEKDISQLLDEYRTSLLVNIYQQKMLEQKYSPLLSDKEIEEYYNQMQDNFTLQENIVKGFLLKVPMGAPNQGDVRRWCRSANSESLVKLENYSLQNARMFDSFLDTWVPFQRVNAILPEPIKNEERFLMYNRYYETTDEQFRYFLLVTDYMTIGNTAPLSYVEDRIRAILLNKKRGEYIKSLEKELYDEALQKKIINFY